MDRAYQIFINGFSLPFIHELGNIEAISSVFCERTALDNSSFAWLRASTRASPSGFTGRRRLTYNLEARARDFWTCLVFRLVEYADDVGERSVSFKVVYRWLSSDWRRARGKG